MQRVDKIRGSLHMEVWEDKKLASEKRIGRELGPWAKAQERTGREKRGLAES